MRAQVVFAGARGDNTQARHIELRKKGGFIKTLLLLLTLAFIMVQASGLSLAQSVPPDGGQSEGAHEESGEDAKNAARDAADNLEGWVSDIGPRIDQARTWISENGSEFSIALAAWIGVFIALRFLRALIAGAARSSKKGEYSVTNIIARFVSSTWSVFLLVVAAALTAPFLPIIPDGWAGAARTGAIIIGIIQAAIWSRELLVSVIMSHADHDPSEAHGVLTNALSLIQTLVGVAVWAIAILMILSNLNVEITALIAGLGVGGIAIGLAAQSLFKDLFSSLAIVFDRPFLRGDFVSFDGGAYMGDVEKIGMKTTRIRSLSGEQIIIANSQLLDKEIRNFRRLDERRSTVTIGVLYATAHEKLRRIPEMIEAAVDQTDGARFDRSHLKEYGDSAIQFETVFWVEHRDYKVFMDVNHQILLAIHKAFEDNGVVFAFPTRTLHVASLPPDSGQ